MNTVEAQERLTQLERALHQHERALIQDAQALPVSNPQKHAHLARLKAEPSWMVKDCAEPPGDLRLSWDDLHALRCDVHQSIANGYSLSASQKIALTLAGMLGPI